MGRGGIRHRTLHTFKRKGDLAVVFACIVLKPFSGPLHKGLFNDHIQKAPSRDSNTKENHIGWDNGHFFENPEFIENNGKPRDHHGMDQIDGIRSIAQKHEKSGDFESEV